MVPPVPGLFSSFGLLCAKVEHHYSRTFRRLTREIDLPELNAAWDAIRDTLRRGTNVLRGDPRPRRPYEPPPARMPWGKYEGKRLRDIELGYLVWVLTKASYTKRELADDVRRELHRREVRMPTRDSDGYDLGDITNDDEAWRAFCREKGW